MKKIVLFVSILFIGDAAFALNSRVLLEFNTTDYDTALNWLTQMQMICGA